MELGLLGFEKDPIFRFGFAGVSELGLCGYEECGIGLAGFSKKLFVTFILVFSDF